MRKSLKEIWYSDEYKQLREKLGDRLCFICFGGSHAYGTNIETSDIDIRGVCLPNTDELIGLNYNPEYVLSVCNEHIDVQIYSFQKFVNLCTKSNFNALELLGCKEYLIFNEVGLSLVSHKDIFLSKNVCKSFEGNIKSTLKLMYKELKDV